MNSNSLITIQDDVIGAKVDDIVKFADIKKESVLALIKNHQNSLKEFANLNSDLKSVFKVSELDKDYFKIIQKRLSEAQGSLF